ncbi:PREDICTED: uncharacterized protein LOC108557433 [Nicrophorus vespilloides]|uniref:Uncharacterized protein LOC108557433 n=1 Tax=Nicrophorus vespilloides TaxID=110193 RepID=A0ABM1M4C9_NICVS|nr:PREDICTED: uncharacterized protein LOC108557433 [Nicrophorus vespilloides]
MALEITTAVSRLMHNKGEPKTSKKRLLGVVAQSIKLYAAPIWECRSYRTIFQDAVQVIAGVPPIELLVLERGERQKDATTADARVRLLQKWQDKWHRSEKGTWTPNPANRGLVKQKSW